MDDRQYDIMARAEADLWWYRSLRQRVGSLIKLAGPQDDAVVLDAGCGTGGLLRSLKIMLPQAQLFGLDLHPRACAGSQASGSPIVRGSVNALPFADACISGIIATDVLCHAGVEETLALSEFRRCLKGDGWLIVNMPAYQWLMSDHDTHVHNARRSTRRGLVKLLQSAGFRAIDSFYWNSILFPLLVVKRKLMRFGGSDIDALPHRLNMVFHHLAAAEYHLGRLGLRAPYGSSVIVLARVR